MSISLILIAFGSYFIQQLSLPFVFSLSLLPLSINLLFKPLIFLDNFVILNLQLSHFVLKVVDHEVVGVGLLLQQL